MKTSAKLQLVAKRSERHRPRPDRCRQRRSASPRPVRDHHVRRTTGLRQRAQHALSHLASAGNDDTVRRERASDLLSRERDRHVRERRRAPGDRGLGARAFADLDRMAEEPVEHRARRSVVAGLGRGVAHLAEDLALTEHGRVEPGRDVEQMPGRRVVVGDEELPLERADGAEGIPDSVVKERGDVREALVETARGLRTPQCAGTSRRSPPRRSRDCREGAVVTFAGRGPRPRRARAARVARRAHGGRRRRPARSDLSFSPGQPPVRETGTSSTRGYRGMARVTLRATRRADQPSSRRAHPVGAPRALWTTDRRSPVSRPLCQPASVNRSAR